MENSEDIKAEIEKIIHDNMVNGCIKPSDHSMDLFHLIEREKSKAVNQALLDELEKQQAEISLAQDYLKWCQEIFVAFPLLSQKLRECVEALEDEVSRCVPYFTDSEQERHARLTQKLDSINSPSQQ